MLLSLRSDHKEHLSLLTQQSTQVLVDFCKLAIDFLQNGPNAKLYNTAAQKLEVNVKDIENAVYGLLNLLLESCKHKLDEIDFRDSVLALGFNQEQQIVLNKFYDSKKQEINESLSSKGVEFPHFYDLQWRLEVQIGSRSLLHQVKPLIAMKLSLETQPDNNQTENNIQSTKQDLILQTDPTNLVHITQVLEQALNESRSRHVRRIQNSFH